MSKDEALDLALEALEKSNRFVWHYAHSRETTRIAEQCDSAITAIKQARALDKKAENARELGLDYEPVGLIDRLTNPEQHYEFTDPKKANAVLMSLCQEAADALAAPVQGPVATLFGSLPVYDTTPPAAQPAVPEGMKLVPGEPTDKMVQAAYHLDLSYMPGQEVADRAAIYRAMLAAAPEKGQP
jgi:hypothetical protein